MRGTSVRGVLAGMLVLSIAAVCVRLGFWQLDRLQERRARNAVVAAAMEAAPLELAGDVLAEASLRPQEFSHRRVRVRGRFLSGESFLLRGRGRDGAPGVHLVTPLVPEGAGHAVLVDRGWLPAPDAATADPRPFDRSGVRTVEGYLHPLEPEPGVDARFAPVDLDGFAVATYQRLDLPTLRPEIPVALVPFYVEESAGVDDEPPFGAEPPLLDEGPHLGYAVQWFGFAAVALIGFAVVVMRSRRPSRTHRPDV